MRKKEFTEKTAVELGELVRWANTPAMLTLPDFIRGEWRDPSH